MTSSRFGREDTDLVPLIVITGGRSVPSRNSFDPISVIKTAPGQPARDGLGPEHLAIVDLCRHGALTVVDIGARLRLPFSIMCILLADLMDSGHIMRLSGDQLPDTSQSPPDRPLMEKVLEGLRALPD